MKLPEQIHSNGRGGGAECTVAIQRVQDIHRYVDECVKLLSQANDQNLGPFLRAGCIKQGWETLETVVRYARCAQGHLKTYAVGAEESGDEQ